MDKAGVSRTILSLRGQRQPNGLISFAARHPERIIAAVRTKGSAYLKGPKQFERFLRKQIQMNQFRAMAEVLLWHARKERAPMVMLGSGGKTGKPPQIVVWPDDPRVKVALDLASEKKWPFVSHIEFAAIGADRALFMDKFEELLRKHSDQPIVLMHMGELDAKEVRRLIESHKNIYFNTAMSNPIAVNRSEQPLVNLFLGETLASDWRHLFILHPDRFILGFDNVFSQHWRKLYVKQVELWKKALKDLPEGVAHAVAHRNSESLWGQYH